MLSKEYEKQCDAGRLQQEIIDAGLPLSPTSGARFYGITCSYAETGWVTTVLFYDDITQAEIDVVDTLVQNHIPTPIPCPENPQDDDHRPFVRAESRPLDMTTYFTSRGDSSVIGDGSVLTFNFNTTDNDVASPPSGRKQKIIDFGFIDEVCIKEGSIYWENMPFSSKISLMIGVPNGAYYLKNNGTPAQNLTGDVLIISKFVLEAPMMGDCPMGDELNTETSSGRIPAGMVFRLLVDVPNTVGNTDNVHGGVVIEMYRKRTVVLE